MSRKSATVNPARSKSSRVRAISPRGTVERIVFPWSIPGKTRSSTYDARPVTFSRPSLRGTFRPTDPDPRLATTVGRGCYRTGPLVRRSALQVPVEKAQDRAVPFDLVLLLGEPVALVGKHDVLDGHAVLLDGSDDVVGLGLDDPGVVRALQDEERALDPVGVEHGRDLAQHLPVFFGVA